MKYAFPRRKADSRKITNRDSIKSKVFEEENGNYYKGSIEFAPNLRWHDVIPLCDMMKEYYPTLPIYLTIKQGDTISGITIEDNADDLFAEQADRIAAWNKALGK